MRLLISLLFLLFSYSTIAEVCTTINNGNWNDPSTWDCNRIPANDDVIIILAGYTVTVNCNCGVYSNMDIEIYGILDFPAGKKINLAADGFIQVYAGGTVTGENGGSKIVINGVSMWSGDDEPIVGPSYVDEGGISTGILPIELIYFKGSILENGSIDLEWTTSSEINNDYFSIQKMNSKGEWLEFGRLDGKISSSVDLKYNYLDNDPVIGYNYYRIVQHDINGNFFIYDAIVILKELLYEINVYMWPNPKGINDNINVELRGFKGEEVLIVITNGSGQIFYEKAVISESNNTLIIIDSSLSRGIYLVIGSSKQELYKKKLIVE